MEFDWRALFDEIRVPWSDRGKNSSRANVNISCPYCGDDPGMHLAVSIEGNGYYCFRNPGQHSGQNLVGLLIKLGVRYNEAQKLLRSHSNPDARSVDQSATLTLSAVQLQWSKFEPAGDSERCLDYLWERGFDEPELIAALYDLRFARFGRWAGRLLLPYYEAGKLISWAGRSLSKRLEPKYLAQHSEESSPLYIPGQTLPIYQKGIIVEGPLDALKIAAACRNKGIYAAALAGKSLPPAKLLRIESFLNPCTEAFICLDADVPLNQVMRTISAIAPRMKSRYVQRLLLPEGHKDPGELSLREIQQWLETLP